MKQFWSKVRKSSPEECWIWTAAKDPRGYGRVTATRLPFKIQLAHRMSWYLSNGPIPEGKCILHKCDNPPCVNPSHLFLGTRVENIYDAAKKGRLIYGIGNMKKTYCPRGHDYFPRRDACGKRECRICKNAMKRAKRRFLNVKV